MNLKKLLLLFIITSIALYSCSKNDNQSIANASSSAIIGTWEVQHVNTKSWINDTLYQDTTIYLNKKEIDYDITFHKDQTFTSKISKEGNTSESSKGIYHFDGHILKIDTSKTVSEDTLFFPKMQCTIHNDEMIMTYDTTFTLPLQEQTISGKFAYKIKLLKE